MNYSGGAGGDAGGAGPRHIKTSGHGTGGQSKEKQEQNAVLADQLADLVSEDPEEKNWKGICIALMVIATILSLIVTAIFLLSPGKKEPRVKNARIEIEEVLEGSFLPRAFNGTWISDTEFVYQSQEGALFLYNGVNSARTLLMSNLTFKQWEAEKYSVSTDKKYILLHRKIEEIYRHSYTANYKVYNVYKKQVFPLLPHEPMARLQFVTWGPIENRMVYVYRNNIYYIPQVSPNPRPRVLTQSGVEDIIFNGIPDWLYEGEILRSNNAIWWSKDGSKICYGTFNDSEVEVVQYPYYGSYSDPRSNIYPQAVNLRYPKPGRAIPTATLWVVDLDKSDLYSQQVVPPDDLYHQDHYFSSVQWVDDSKLAIVWLSRYQNTSLLTFCSASTNWICEKHIAEESPNGKGWQDLHGAGPVFNPSDSSYYFMRLSIRDGKAGFFRHVHVVDFESGRPDFLTFGQYDVVELLRYQPETNCLYFISTLYEKPGERHLFVMQVQDRNATCLTCELEDCLFAQAHFSLGTIPQFYVLECLGPGVPRSELRNASDNSLVAVLDLNQDLQELVDNRALPQVRTYQVPLHSGYKANVRVLLPPGLRDEEIIKYGLIVHIDGSPGSQLVNERFSVGWGAYLASQINYLYAEADCRGSGFQGQRREAEIYRQLGSVEILDHLTVVNYLRRSLPFVHTDKVLVWGWGYGGYVAASALALDQGDAIRCGIAVAPITSWFYHDAAYTERYMGGPQPDDNYIGYEKGDLLKRAEDFLDKEFLIIHGTADDEVHIQHSYMLMKSLADAGVMFRTQIYPDERHQLHSVRSHFYHTMENFIEFCFDLGPDEDTDIDAVVAAAEGA